MAKEVTDTDLEETRAALRDGIERAKALVHDYEQRVRPQPAALDEPKPPKPPKRAL